MKEYKADFYANGERECTICDKTWVLQSLKSKLLNRYADNDGSIERIIEHTSKKNQSRTITVVLRNGTYVVYTLPYASES